MPARPAVPKVVQIVMFFKLGGDLDVVNRFYQEYSGTAGSLSDSGATAWATAVSSAWGTHLSGDFSHELALEQITVTDLSSNVGGFGSFLPTLAGTSTDPSLPAGTAFVIKEHIERRYRGGHPRQYLAGLTQNELDTPQTWKSATVAQIVSDYTAFRAAAAAGCPVGIGPAVDVNVSYFQGFTNHTYPSGRVRPIPNLRGTPLVDVISTFGGNQKVGSQRRRNQQSL